MITEDDIHRYYWSVALANPIPGDYTTYPGPSHASTSTRPTYPPVLGHDVDSYHHSWNQSQAPASSSRPSTTGTTKRHQKALDIDLDLGPTNINKKEEKEKKHGRRSVRETSLGGERDEKSDERGDKKEKRSDKKEMRVRDGKKHKHRDDDVHVEEEGTKKKKRRKHLPGSEETAKHKHRNKDKPRKRRKMDHDDDDDDTDAGTGPTPAVDQEEMDLEEIDELLPSSPGFGPIDQSCFTFSPPITSTPTALMTPHKPIKSKSRTKSTSGPIAGSSSNAIPKPRLKKRQSNSSTFDHPHTHTHAHTLADTSSIPYSLSQPIPTTTSTRPKPIGTKIVHKPDSYRLKAIPGHLRTSADKHPVPIPIPIPVPVPDPLRQSDPPLSTTIKVGSGTGERADTGARIALDNGVDGEGDKDKVVKKASGSRWPTWATSTPDFLKIRKR